MSLLDKEEILSGIITWENDEERYVLHLCKKRKMLPKMLAMYQSPYELFPDLVKGKIIIPLVAKRKYFQEIIQKLNACHPRFLLAA